MQKPLLQLYKKYIEGTVEKAIVVNSKILLCHLTTATVKGCDISVQKVYISTRALKHLYDKKPAEEFTFIIENLHTITKYPDFVYKNKDSKRGDVCLTKQLKGENYICCIEEVVLEDNSKEINIATAFRIRKENYLKNFELLWSWKDDTPSS